MMRSGQRVASQKFRRLAKRLDHKGAEQGTKYRSTPPMIGVATPRSRSGARAIPGSTKKILRMKQPLPR
jgi:hypothetical protein